MVSETVKKAKELWNVWDIRVLILLSLLIQVILNFLAPLRKRSASGTLKFIMWLLYLSANAIALYTISHITGQPNDIQDKVDLLAFWSPFLLLHLGGPDSLTALALEDNELWKRHALELVTQVGVTSYVFANSVRRPNSRLWLPTMLMFVNGCIKYMERTQALYRASIDSFRESLETEPESGPNYARLMDVYYSSKTANIPIVIHGRQDSISDEDGSTSNPIASANDINDFVREDTDPMVNEAYHLYTKFKGILADNYLSFKDRKETRDKFIAKKAAEAVRIIEIELNFIYDVFYTKAFLVDSRQTCLRVVSYISVLASLSLFSLAHKENYEEVDVAITYILLGGALALDVSGFVMLMLSDWYVIIDSQRRERQKWQRVISTNLLKMFQYVKNKNLRSDRWSRSISRYNLLERCFKDLPRIFKKVDIPIRIKDLVIGFLYVKNDKVNEKRIVKFIVDELKRKATINQNRNTDDDEGALKEVCSARGNLILDDEYCLISDYLQPWTTEVEYDESVLTWHIATDICYHTCESIDNIDKLISKNLSDYMAYLLLRQQTLVATVVGMSDKRLADTRAEAKKFLTDKRLPSWGADIWLEVKNFMYKVTGQSSKIDEYRQEKKSKFLKKLCKEILNVNVDVRPILAKGDKSKSVLFEACSLAKQLKMLNAEEQWKIISKVWLELLCYAAVRCSPRSHVAQLNKGGELITIVWLLMAHLGFGDRFLQNQGFGWTKLVVQK